MNIFFRVDSNKSIGSGHFARCSYFAEFITSASSYSVVFLSKQKDFILHKFFSPVLKIQFINGKDIKSDADETIQVLKKSSAPKILIVDSYLHDKTWEDLVRPHVDFLIVIDDLANRDHFCDLLVDCGYQRLASDYKGKVLSGTQLCIGLNYCFISPGIQKIKYLEKVPQRIHLYFGATVPNELVLEYFTALKTSLPDFSFHVALAVEAHPEQLKNWNLMSGADDRIFIQQALSTSLVGCTFAIGAPGIATWERAFLGMPAMYIGLNENQMEIIKDLEKMSFCKSVGSINDGVSSISIKIKEFIQQWDAKKIKKQLTDMIDGQGMRRIFEIIKKNEK